MVFLMIHSAFIFSQKKKKHNLGVFWKAIIIKETKMFVLEFVTSYSKVNMILSSH